VMQAGRWAVLNAEVPEFTPLLMLSRRRGHRVIAYGEGVAADLRLLAARPTPAGQALDLLIFEKPHSVFLSLLGRFQTMNALAALGLAIATGAAPADAAKALGALAGVPGRIQHVASHPNGAPIFVDYAHTPDALQTVLSALRPHCRGRLVAVFGAGGDRDPGKRPLMGAVVARLADRAIVTDDNPRNESPAAIREAVLAGVPGAREIGDRTEAIATAIAELAPEDLLVIAGKGHERGQTVAGLTHPFDDAEVARAAVAALAGKQA